MKARFRKWLLFFVILAFGSTFGLSWYLHRKEAKENALQLLDVNLTDVAGRVKRAEANLQTITEMSAASAIAKTRAFALLIKAKPSILLDPEELKLIRRKLDVDELHVSDKTGKLIASLVADGYHGKGNYLNFNLAEEKQSKVFMQAVTDPSFELVQEPQLNGAERKLFQYTGVARLDEPGVVQIGYSPERIKRARQLADIKNIESDTRIGFSGKLFISENTRHPADYKSVYGTDEGLFKAVVCGKHLLTAMLPWKEVYSKDRAFITAVFIVNIIVFALIFAVVAILLQKLVIKKISAVTDSLNEVSKGNFNKTIEVKGSAELRALAESINKTVNMLKINSAQPRAESELEISTMLKNSLVPANIPQYPEYKFTANISAASNIGVNLCDIFEVDKKYIAMFFADVTESGIAPGLRMIKARDILKKALLKNSPEKALRMVNEELLGNGDKATPLKAYLGILNLRSGVLQTFNAGHVDPVIKSKSGNAGFIKGPFIPPLGVSAEPTFIPMSMQLNPGDKFYFYSTGTIEIPNAQGEKYGRDRLLDVISSSGSDAQVVIESIRQNLTEFTGESTLNSDIAIAVLEYTPTA